MRQDVVAMVQGPPTPCSRSMCVCACVCVWPGRVFMRGGRSLEVLPSSEDVSLFNGLERRSLISFHVAVQSFRRVAADGGAQDRTVAWKRTAAAVCLGH